MRNRQTLTKGEEEVMQALWALGEANCGEIIELMAEPKPKYTTIATFLKILKSKEYIDCRLEGKSYTYFPLISREAHAKLAVTELLNNYFEGSFSGMVSFFSQNENLSVNEVNELVEILEKSKK